VDSDDRPAIWINILEREGWIVIPVEGRKVGIVIGTTEAGRSFLKIAGFHLGSNYIGERHNMLSVHVTPIPLSLQNPMQTLIRNALPVELRALPMSFL
jgi:hypothetical protein